MRYIKASIFTVLLFMLIPITVFSQDEQPEFFEGELSYKVEIKGADAELIKANKPNNLMTMNIKEGNYIVRLTGGRYPKVFMFVRDSNYEYSVDLGKKLAYTKSPYKNLRARSNPVAFPTGNTKEVNGVECDEYKMNDKKGATFTFYVNDAYVVDLKPFEKKFRAKAYFLIDGLDGRIPLKIIKKDKTLTSITTIKEINRKSYSIEQFMLPADFIIKKRDYRW